VLRRKLVIPQVRSEALDKLRALAKEMRDLMWSPDEEQWADYREAQEPGYKATMAEMSKAWEEFRPQHKG
jgi:hypothetical protein